MKPLVLAAPILLGLSACSPGGLDMAVHGTLPNPIFELTSTGSGPCLTEFRVLAVRPANAFSVANWSIRKPSGCLKPASVVYGSAPDGFVDRYPGEEGAKSYPAIHWPLPLQDNVLYQVTATLSGGRKATFMVEFDGQNVSVKKRP